MGSEKINGVTFMTWLELQGGRNDPVGDVARRVKDVAYAVTFKDASTLLDYFKEYESRDGFAAAEEAVTEWRRKVVTIRPKPAKLSKNEKQELCSKVMTKALNHLLRTQQITLEAGGHDANADIITHFDAGGVLGLVRAREISFGEVEISVLLSPKPDAENWIGMQCTSDGMLKYGDVECSAWLERKTGKWLQINKDYGHFAASAFVIDGVRSLKAETPIGFEPKGKFLR